MKRQYRQMNYLRYYFYLFKAIFGGDSDNDD